MSWTTASLIYLAVGVTILAITLIKTRSSRESDRDTAAWTDALGSDDPQYKPPPRRLIHTLAMGSIVFLWPMIALVGWRRLRRARR
jgi:hypothetical protein